MKSGPTAWKPPNSQPSPIGGGNCGTVLTAAERKAVALQKANARLQSLDQQRGRSAAATRGVESIKGSPFKASVAKLTPPVSTGRGAGADMLKL